MIINQSIDSSSFQSPRQVCSSILFTLAGFHDKKTRAELRESLLKTDVFADAQRARYSHF